MRADLLATVRREVWNAAIEIAKAELVPEPCSELDESFNAATRDVITKLEKASATGKGEENG